MCKQVQIYLFRLSYKLTSDLTFDLDLWPFDHMNIQRFPYYINKPSLVQIRLQLFKWGHFHIFSLSYNLTSHNFWPWYVTVDLLNKWGFPYINKPSLVPVGLQLFKWGHFHIFSLSYNLTSDGLWPWYVTFELINKLGFPCCIYDPTLMKSIKACGRLSQMFLFSQQQTTIDNNNRQQWTKWSLCVFPAKAGDTKKVLHVLLVEPWGMRM